MEPSPTNPPTDFYRLQHRPTTREGNLRSADMRILLSFSGNPPRIVCELAHTRTITYADLSALGGPRASSACDSQESVASPTRCGGNNLRLESFYGRTPVRPNCPRAGYSDDGLRSGRYTKSRPHGCVFVPGRPPRYPHRANCRSRRSTGPGREDLRLRIATGYEARSATPPARCHCQLRRGVS